MLADLGAAPGVSPQPPAGLGAVSDLRTLQNPSRLALESEVPEENSHPLMQIVNA